MLPLILALRVIALVLLVMAAAAVPSRVNLTAAGLAVWLLSQIV